jgi:hypothetical protein
MHDTVTNCTAKEELLKVKCTKKNLHRNMLESVQIKRHVKANSDTNRTLFKIKKREMLTEF